MNFVQWCGIFLSKLLELQEASATASSMGVRFDQLERALSGEQPSRPRSQAVSRAFEELKRVGILEQDRRLPQYLKIPRPNRELALNQRVLWVEISGQAFAPDEAQLLRALNRLSEHRQPDFAYVDMVPYEDLYLALELQPGYETEQKVDSLLRNLKALGYATLGPAINRSNLAARSTYLGLVWEHRRGITVTSQAIDDLVAEGETPTVDLKRQLAIDTKPQKAELIKDVIALANTKATGPRYLIIGFTDDGQYYAPGNPQERAERDRLLESLSEERLQTIVSEHTTPVLQIRYTTADYYDGPVGMLEVLRDLAEIPYMVRKTLGSTDRKDGPARQVREGQIFLRDGTVTREARPEEIDRMNADAERAKRRKHH